MDADYERELNRKYHRTVVAIYDQITKENWLVSVSGIEAGMLMGYGIPKPTTLVTSTENLAAANVAFKLGNITIRSSPEAQVFDWNGHTVVFEHNPARQWRLGVCSDNSRLFYPVYNILEKIWGVMDKANWSMRSFSESRAGLAMYLNLFFVNHTNNILTAIKEIDKKGLYSRTVNKDWFVCLGLEDKQHFLFYRHYHVATIEGTTIIVHHEPMHQEVCDLVNRNGDYFYVKVG